MRYRILSIATEWFSYHGGLSTFNRSFCAAAADAGHDVACLLPSISREEVENAAAAHVRLIEAPRVVGLSAEACLCLPIEGLDAPDIVVGHGHITGSVAAARVEHFHKGARRIHFLHTLPEEIEPHKAREGSDATQRAQRKQDSEAQLALSATLAVAVGPRLDRQWNTHMAGIRGGVVVHRLTPGPPPAERVTEIPRSPWYLLMGRLEDMELKGVDIAAAAIGMIARDDQFRGAREPTLVLRGATPGTSEALRAAVREYAGTGILCNVKEYTHLEERVREDIARASVVLMPSRVEGFGLVALEALAMGVPILVSQRSGFGELLLERIEAEPGLQFARKYVVDVRDDLATDARSWADAIGGMLGDRETVFREAESLREAFESTGYWRRAIEDMFVALSIPARAPDAMPDTPPDMLEMARTFAVADPAVAIAMSTSVLEREMESQVAARGIAKRGLEPAMYLALIRNKGFLSPANADFARELLRRRNLAVHEKNLPIDQSQAEDHLRSVEALVRELRVHQREESR